MPTHFTPATLKFLRGLKRHNDRAWFNERKPVFEQELRQPFLHLIDEVNHALEAVAPEHIRPAAKCMMRIYRDIRFSNDKRPYKSQIAAWWARAGLEKTSGAGFYLSLSATELTIAAGAYMPERDQMLAIRRHLLEHHAEFRALMADPALQTVLQPIDGQPLRRVPKGFAPDTPALDLIVQRQWGVASTLPAEHALKSSLLADVVHRFTLAAPVVALLNAPLTIPSRKPIF